MREKHLFQALSGLRDERATACALVFLHELSADHTAGQPPREACWQRILDRPEAEWGEAFDRACRACLDAWPEQLDGFFPDPPFASQPAYALKQGVRAIEKLCVDAPRHGGPWARETLLADVSQNLRSLSGKQWMGAFFTPWNLALMMATMQLDDSEARELWVLEPAVGGGVLLLAALHVYREKHGARLSRAMTMIGVDLDPQVCTIARASLILAGADPRQFWIFNGNALAQPIVGRNRVDGALHHLSFHVVLANPPYGGKETDASLRGAAERGPLVVPDRVLYRVLNVERGSLVQDPTPAVRAIAEAEKRPAKRLPPTPDAIRAAIDRKAA